MQEKLKKIDINKVIIVMLAIIIILLLTIVIMTFRSFSNKDYQVASSSKNEYATNNKSEIKEETASDNKEVITEVKSDDVSIREDNTIAYFEDVEAEVNAYVAKNDTKKLGTVAKEKFVTLVDFIFYGTEINGVTFKELSLNTQNKLVDIINRIDVKIENKVPNYKEDIKSDVNYSYTYLSGKLKEGITYLDGKIEEKIGTEKYNDIKDNTSIAIDKTKEKTSEILEKGKEIANSAKENIKNWYEGWK